MSAPPLPERIRRFPFPFPQRFYRYSTNVEPAREPVETEVGEWGRWMIDIDDEYEHELLQRSEILAADPGRCVVLDHMRSACWDTLLECLGEAARGNPAAMSLTREGDWYVWSNARLGEERRFGMATRTASAPAGRTRARRSRRTSSCSTSATGSCGPTPALVTFAADWSLRFDVGMSSWRCTARCRGSTSTGVIPARTSS